jgi:hypothetical protein
LTLRRASALLFFALSDQEMLLLFAFLGGMQYQFWAGGQGGAP